MSEENKKNNEDLGKSPLASKVLIEPIVTEASTKAVEFNKYVFKVAESSNKCQIKKAIENLYKVAVVSVNISNVKRRARNYGKTPGFKAGFKKAIVTLKYGDSIELFKNA